MQKKVIEIRLTAYVPINDNICIDSLDHVHVYAIKFQGNPVSIFPLRNSNIEKINEKNKTKKIFLSANEDDIKTANPKKHDKNMGIIIKAKESIFI